MFDAAVATEKPQVPFPAGIRLPVSEDRDRLITFLMYVYASDGQWSGGVDHDEVEAMVDRAIDRRNIMLGIIDGPERIEAAIGFMPNKPWWGDDHSWYWHDVIFAVHPKHRKSGHFRTLIKFADWFAATCGAPVVQNVQSDTDLTRKLTMFLRFWKMVGGTFLVGDGHG